MADKSPFKIPAIRGFEDKFDGYGALKAKADSKTQIAQAQPKIKFKDVVDNTAGYNPNNIGNYLGNTQPA